MRESSLLDQIRVLKEKYHETLAVCEEAKLAVVAGSGDSGRLLEEMRGMGKVWETQRQQYEDDINKERQKTDAASDALKSLQDALAEA